LSVTVKHNSRISHLTVTDIVPKVPFVCYSQYNSRIFHLTVTGRHIVKDLICLLQSSIIVGCPILLLQTDMVPSVSFDCYRQTLYRNLRHVMSRRMKQWDVATRWPAICICSATKEVPDCIRRMISENITASPANSLTCSSEREALDSSGVFQTTT